MAFPDILLEEKIAKISQRIYIEGIMGIKLDEAPPYVKNQMLNDRQYKRITEIIRQEIDEHSKYGKR